MRKPRVFSVPANEKFVVTETSRGVVPNKPVQLRFAGLVDTYHYRSYQPISVLEQLP